MIHFIQKLHARVVQLENGVTTTTTTATIVENPSTLVETKLEPTVVQPISNNVISIPQLTTEEAKNQLLGELFWKFIVKNNVMKKVPVTEYYEKIKKEETNEK